VADGSLPYGLLAAGTANGSVQIVDPGRLISRHDAPVVATIDSHSGPVRGLEFNPAVPELLASGAAESEVFITDLTNPSTPRVVSPGAKSPGPGADISCVAWNRRVTHILASTSHNGLSVVWDLKLKKPVINFTNSANRGQRNSVIAWNPEVATQIIVASEDDAFPSMQIWDLRNAFAPVKELTGHSKGILTASWCPQDENLLISSGKDNRTLCWDPATGEVLCELPPSANWTFDVQWSPCLPALLSSASFSGEVAVHSLADASATAGAEETGADGFSVQEPHAGKPMIRAPKWLRRPCGASFGFGGKLVRFSHKSSEVTIEDVPSDTGVVARAEQLRAALEAGDLAGFCAHKAEAAPSERDADDWKLMEVLCSHDQRTLVLGFLGLVDPNAPPPAEPQAEAAYEPQYEPQYEAQPEPVTPATPEPQPPLQESGCPRPGLHRLVLDIPWDSVAVPGGARREAPDLSTDDAGSLPGAFPEPPRSLPAGRQPRGALLADGNRDGAADVAGVGAGRHGGGRDPPRARRRRVAHAARACRRAARAGRAARDCARARRPGRVARDAERQLCHGGRGVPRAGPRRRRAHPGRVRW